MTRNDRRLRRKKPLGIGVFFVFLLVLFNILGLLATIFVATPLGKMFLFDVEGGIRGTLNSYIVPRVQTWLLDAFNLSHTVFGMGEVQTAYVYLAALFEALMLAGLFFYFPFFVMGHNRIVNKKGASSSSSPVTRSAERSWTSWTNRSTSPSSPSSRKERF